MPRNAWEFKGTFLVKNAKILIFWNKNSLKRFFYPDKNFQLIFIMLQINCTKHFFNIPENVLFMQFKKKVKFPKISTSVSKTFLN